MEQTLQKLQALGLDTAAGIGYTGSVGKYIAALGRYAGSSTGNIADIEKFLGKRKLDRYMIAVHAVKSNSKMIGHTGLFKAFESLETAARNNDTEFIAANTAPALKRYAELSEELRPITEAPAGAAAPAIGFTEAAEIAEKLLEALDDFDDELSAELVTKLSGYPFGDGDREKLAGAKKYISDYMYDEAADIIRTLRGSLR